MNCDPRGSIWRRWDLHFHTPASYDYRNKSVDAKALVDGLIAAGTEVVAVTDHHIIDTNLIRTMQQLGRDKLVVLPGIELRSELGGSEYVHYIGIFPEDCDLDDVWIKMCGLGISAADVKRNGDENVYVRIEEGCARIHDLGGIVTVHAGKKKNSIEKLTNADAVKRAIKADLARQFFDVMEVGRVSDCDGYKQIVFPNIGKTLPLVLCSDDHNIHEYAPKTPMWIKADPNFLGLLQILHEPDTRVFLGDTPPSVLQVEQNATKYIDSISFAKTGLAHAEENWFDGEIPFNSGLVAIIGNKGMGKSALADVIALCGNTHATNHFSFLTRDRFLSPKLRLGSMFEATIVWKSGRQTTARLDRAPQSSDPELVKYIPQKFLETICTELQHSSDTLFDRELKDVIFSHVPEAERLGKDTLQDLIAYLTDETEERIRQLAAELSAVNQSIVALEEQLKPQHRHTLQGQLRNRQEELAAHETAKPAVVPEPDQDASAKAATIQLTNNLHNLQESIAACEVKIAAAKTAQQNAARRVASADKLLDRIENLEHTYQRFLRESADDFESLGLDLQTTVTFKVDKTAIAEVKKKGQSSHDLSQRSIDFRQAGSLGAKLVELHQEAEHLQQQLDEPNRRFQSYLKELKKWEARRASIEGSAEMAGSLRGLEARIAALDTLPEQIERAEGMRKELSLEIYSAKERLLARYRQLFAPVQEFIDQHPISRDHGALQFEASVAVTDLTRDLLAMIHLGRKGSFMGDQEGQARLQSLIASADFATQDGTMEFIDQVLDHLRNDWREVPHQPVSLGDQLRQGFKSLDVYDFLFDLRYLRPRFELRWQDKNLDQLSPGERGNLLLIFYLLIDKRDVPLIIDQPEENLDNQTITKMLVPAIKEAKERRQIIIVTHNPNLAVVCDADQIVHARMEKTLGNRLIYTSGGIENPQINQLIIDVLEGTKPAFDLRDAKYDVLERVR